MQMRINVTYRESWEYQGNPGSTESAFSPLKTIIILMPCKLNQPNAKIQQKTH